MAHTSGADREHKVGSDNLCDACRGNTPLDFDFHMVFQPIFDASGRTVFAHEALVRGPQGQGAGWVFGFVNDGNLYQFDQACRTKAIQQAAQLNINSLLSINFLPNAVYRPELCIRKTLEAAEASGFPISNIMFEFTESEKMTDIAHVKNIINHYRQMGFKTAIDDFGAGYSGLNLLSDLATDYVKLDMALIRDIDSNPRKQAIVRGTMAIANELGTSIIAEGVETAAEMQCLQDLGVSLFQGFYLARPEAQPVLAFPEV